MKYLLITISFMLLIVQPVSAEVIFIGIPEVRVQIQEGVVARADLTLEEQKKKRVVISRVNGKYYWVSRENRPLERHYGGGMYTFYISPQGTGYIKVANKEDVARNHELAKNLGIEIPEKWYTYVEHLTWATGSVNYFGNY